MRTRLELNGRDRGCSSTCGSTPTVNGNGGGGAATAAPTTRPSTGTTALVTADTAHGDQAVNRDYAVPLFGALRADRPFRASAAATRAPPATASPSSTPLTRSPAYSTAPDGNVVRPRGSTSAGRHDPRARLRHQPRPRRSTTAGASSLRVLRRAPRALRRVVAAYDAHAAPARRAGSRRAERRLPVGERAEGQRGQDLPRRGRGRAGQPVGPGGQRRRLPAGKPPYFGSYREVFARDLYEAFTGLLAAGDLRPRRTPPASSSSASSSPTAACRATPCSTAARRRTPVATSSTRPRTRS